MIGADYCKSVAALPQYYYQRIKQSCCSRGDYPLPLVLLEIVGGLAGPWSLSVSAPACQAKVAAALLSLFLSALLPRRSQQQSAKYATIGQLTAAI